MLLPSGFFAIRDPYAVAQNGRCSLPIFEMPATHVARRAI
jgi:hypothetical protein